MDKIFQKYIYEKISFTILNKGVEKNVNALKYKCKKYN